MESKVLESNMYPDIVFRSTEVRRTGAVVWGVSGDLTLHGVTKPVSVDVTRQDDAYVGTVRIKQAEFGIQPIKIGGDVVRVKDELEISHYERCAAFGKARPRNPPAPPLSMICRSPELYFVSCKAEGQASFCWPMGVTYADRAANYCSEWGAVRLMEVPPTSIAGLAGTSRSPAGSIITAPLNHTTMHKDGESQETNSAALGYSELMVSDNLVSYIRICVGLPS